MTFEQIEIAAILFGRWILHMEPCLRSVHPSTEAAMTPRITREQARALREGLDNPWYTRRTECGVTVVSRGEDHDYEVADVDYYNRGCNEKLAALIAAAPNLARTVEELHEEIERLERVEAAARRLVRALGEDDEPRRAAIENMRVVLMLGVLR